MSIKEEYLEELAFLEMEEIKDELIAFLNTLDISYELENRVKSLTKIHQKQELYSERSNPVDLFDIPDIIGFRISVNTEEDVVRIFSILNKYFVPFRIIDFFNNPKFTGYKAFNCFYDIWGFKTEIQIMTKDMRDWTNATHDEHNERKYGDIIRDRKLLKK